MTRFVIQPDRSTVFIEARSSLHPIRSETSGLEGYLETGVLEDGRPDTSGDCAGHLELEVQRLSSGNPVYDREMQRRIDGRRYPTIAGELTALEQKGEPGAYLVRGELTFHGVTQSTEDLMRITSPGAGSMRLEGEHVFDIRQFGVEPPKLLMLKVHPDVSVRVEIVAEAAT